VCELCLSGLGCSQITDIFEHVSVSSGSIKCGEFLEKITFCYILVKDPVLCSFIFVTSVLTHFS
jgi:hypothetical protein